jgi:hypothetical protein
MNIFVLNRDPFLAAFDMCDKHVVKMILEGCQMLSTIHRMAGSHVVHAPVDLYKMAFANHPCTVWARMSAENYMWLANHTHALCNEYTNRYGKTHKASEMSCWFCRHVPPNLHHFKMTPFAQAMPDKYKHEDAVVAYRQYYLGEKARFAKWKHGNVPAWFDQKNPMLGLEVAV